MAASEAYASPPLLDRKHSFQAARTAKSLDQHPLFLLRASKCEANVAVANEVAKATAVQNGTSNATTAAATRDATSAATTGATNIPVANNFPVAATQDATEATFTEATTAGGIGSGDAAASAGMERQRKENSLANHTALSQKLLLSIFDDDGEEFVEEEGGDEEADREVR
ncbi:hypothetical protein AAVH_08427 [Aphelenchoides avenae]|nr:hypothetical protein AAVH_08427 [Aphelenchus avenae]